MTKYGIAVGIGQVLLAISGCNTAVPAYLFGTWPSSKHEYEGRALIEDSEDTFVFRTNLTMLSFFYEEPTACISMAPAEAAVIKDVQLLARIYAPDGRFLRQMQVPLVFDMSGEATVPKFLVGPDDPGYSPDSEKSYRKRLFDRGRHSLELVITYSKAGRQKTLQNRVAVWPYYVSDIRP